MTEDEARNWVQRSFDVPRETMGRLEAFAAMLADEAKRQNLVSSASLGHIWNRHIADSAQLLRFAPESDGSWIDLGSGAGFPGLIVAMLGAGPMTLVEERRLRVDFLRRAAAALDLDVEIIGERVERMQRRKFAVISARAFAPLERLLDLGMRFSTGKSVWLLPKGRNAQSELEAIGSSWQGEFRLERSLTDTDARIIVASGVARKDNKKA